jgi:hypothetical protein
MSEAVDRRFETMSRLYDSSNMNMVFYHEFVGDIRRSLIDTYLNEQDKTVSYKFLYYWVLFEYLQVYKGNQSYCRQFVKMYYKYLSKADNNEFELNRLSQGDFIASNINKLMFCIRISDFTSIKSICEAVTAYLSDGKLYVSTSEYFITLFRYFYTIADKYLHVLDLSQVDKSKMVEFDSYLHNALDECNYIIDNIKKYQGDDIMGKDIVGKIPYLYLAVRLLTGNFSVDDLLAVASSNLDLLLLTFTYRFFKSDCFEIFLKTLETQIKRLDGSGDASAIGEIKLIYKSATLRGIEYISEFRNEIPIWMQFLMIEIINEKEHDVYNSRYGIFINNI